MAWTGAVGWTQMTVDDRCCPFDIYLKVNISWAISFFKSTGKENQQFQMFPYVKRSEERIWAVDHPVSISLSW